MTTAASRSRRPAVVLAVKSLSDAKTRLTPLPQHADRRTLVAAMLDDTLDAVQALTDDVIVVSPDPDVRRRVTDRGAVAVEEPTSTGGLSPLNAALAHGAARRGGRIAFLQADLPALRRDSLAQALDAAADTPAAFVADRSGRGTALLVADPGFAPRFGVDSAHAHRTAGATELDPEQQHWADLRTDIDTPDDLAVAAGLGLGPRTAALLHCTVPAPPGSTGQHDANAAQ